MSSENNIETTIKAEENTTEVNSCVNSKEESTKESSSPRFVVQSYSYSRKVVDGKVVEKKCGVKHTDNGWFVLDENNDWTPSTKEEALSAPKRVKTITHTSKKEKSDDGNTLEHIEPERKSKEDEEEISDKDLLREMLLLSMLTHPSRRRRTLSPLYVTFPVVRFPLLDFF